MMVIISRNYVFEEISLPPRKQLFLNEPLKYKTPLKQEQNEATESISC